MIFFLDTLVTDLIIYKTCIVKMLLPETACVILHDNSSSDEAKSLAAKVQQNIAPVIIYKSVIDAFIPIILSLFLGPWGDKFGRKVLLLIPLTGYFLNYLSLSVFSLWNISPFWVLTSSFCAASLGGRPTLFLTFMCYIGDVSKAEDKAWNLALMDMSIYLTFFVGLFAGPYLFNHYGYHVVFGISAIVCLFAILYTMVLLKETVVYTGNEVLIFSGTNKKIDVCLHNIFNQLKIHFLFFFKKKILVNTFFFLG